MCISICSKVQTKRTPILCDWGVEILDTGIAYKTEK